MPFLDSRSTVPIVGHHGEDAGVGFALIASAAPQSSADSNGLFSEVLLGADQDEPGKMFPQSHHTQGCVDREYLFLEVKLGPRDPFLLS
jgi:hypothetical protein